MLLVWWLIATIAGLGALPLCFRLLSALPDKGYLIARAAGLLLTGFTFWILGTFGLLKNDPGGITLAWLLVLMIGGLLYSQAPIDLRAWWKAHRGAILTAEVLFAVLFLVWATVRAHQHGLNGTEKPMDLAFLSALTRSPFFPPDDPWLAGYSISYYYFGYLIGGMFTQISGVATTIAYNLWTAMLFALVGLTTFGVVYNLVYSRRLRDVDQWEQTETPETPETPPSPPIVIPNARGAILSGLLGVVILLIMGNWQFALVSLPYEARIATTPYLQFWDVNIRQTALPPGESDPRFWGGDYFRAARAMNDRNLPSMVAAGYGEREEVINEFPMFSYLLADNHPHVMALPFTLLAMGLALNVLLSAAAPSREQILFYGVIIGGLAFLNTWDSPTYLLILVGAELLRRQFLHNRLHLSDWLDLFMLGGALLLVTLIAYLPFIVNFRSQLGGFLPNVIHPTPIQQYLLVFGALVPLVAIFLIVEAWRGRRDNRISWGYGALIAGGTVFGLIAILIGLLLLGNTIPSIRAEILNFVGRVGGWETVLPEILNKRWSHLPTVILLALGLLLVIARLFPRLDPDKLKGAYFTYPAATGFALMLIGAGIGLTLIPDFVYLRDVFGSRMNTVFKFYYQAWVLFAIASTYGLYTILADTRLRLPALPVRGVIWGGALVTIAMGLLYPLFAVWYRTDLEGTRITLNGETAITLDGWRTVVNPDDYETLTCLQAKVGRDPVVIAEVTGGSYDFIDPPGPLNSGRTGALTGMPTIIGWQGHQSQWRGNAYSEVVGTRPDDIRSLYTDLVMDDVWRIIEKYGIQYIVYGAAERSRYGAAGEQKFLETMDVVCESASGQSRIFATGVATGAR